MISDTELLNIYNSYADKVVRKYDSISVPFSAFPTIDERMREFEWYAIRFERLLSALSAVNYRGKSVLIKRSIDTVNCKWTIEIPYEARSNYIDLIYTLNQAVSIDGCITLFISNNPYDLCSYICLEDIEENSARIKEILQNTDAKLISEKGISEFYDDMIKGRRFDVKYIPYGIDMERLTQLFQSAFIFSEKETLRKLGYNDDINSKRKKVFISYCHANKNVVYNITDKLENCGIDLWIDKKSIDYGDNIARSISTGIKESDLAILFLSNDIINSNFSQFELENVISNMIKKTIGWFIVKLDDINVDEVLPNLSNYLYYNFYQDGDIDKITETIIKKIDKL